MKVGLCASVDQIEMVEKIGFDYIEPSVVSIAQMDEKEYQDTLARVNKAGIDCETFNVLFPGDVRLTGPDANLDGVRKYLIEAFERIAKLGARIVVFGSGGARRVPEDWGLENGWKDLVKAARFVGEIVSRYDITIAMEPLNKGETNILNSISDGIELIKEVDHPNIKLLADFYHMRVEKESMDILKQTNSDVLVHTHIAKGHGRSFPLTIDEDIYKDFFQSLKEIGYDGRVSIEGRTDHLHKDGPIALKLLRELVLQ